MKLDEPCTHPAGFAPLRTVEMPNGGTFECRICHECLKWLSLGDSNDEPDVLVEIRGAEIAADCHGPRQFIGTEWDGWRREETIDLTVVSRDGSRREQRLVPLNLDSPKWRAGYLAREIVTHDDAANWKATP